MDGRPRYMHRWNSPETIKKKWYIRKVKAISRARSDKVRRKGERTFPSSRALKLNIMLATWENYRRYESTQCAFMGRPNNWNWQESSKGKQTEKNSSPGGMEVDERVNGRRKERVPRRRPSLGAICIRGSVVRVPIHIRTFYCDIHNVYKDAPRNCLVKYFTARSIDPPHRVSAMHGPLE